MKVSTRPVSSPGRVDRFPPQLMAFRRTNVSSRSNRVSRSRASPIFVKQGTSVAETKEPSSPKVTCMGQVRVRRSKQGTRKKGTHLGRHDRWRWIPGIFFCRSSKGGGVGIRFSFFRRSMSCMLSRPKWVSFFQFGRGGGSGGKDGDFGHRLGDTVEEDDNDDEEKIKGKVNCFGPSPCSPPKNALILTRCRSAPYTSSSLAYRFWGSQLEAEKAVHQRSADQLPKTEHAGSENGGFAEEEPEWKETDCDGNPSRRIKLNWERQNMDGTGALDQDEDRAVRSGNGEFLRTGDRESETVSPPMLTR